MKRRMRSGEPRYPELLEQERLILDATELVERLRQDANITRSELAGRIGKSKGYVSQVLDGSRNMTLRTLASFVYALGQRVRLESRPLWAERSHQAEILPVVKAASMLNSGSFVRPVSADWSERLALTLSEVSIRSEPDEHLAHVA